MNIMKSALLGTAATLVAVAGAQAADLPSKKAAPATYVKICDAYGAGFFYIPGTETCLHVGGYVRAEYQYTPAVNTYTPKAETVAATLQSVYAAAAIPKNLQDTMGYEVRGRIEVDARTPTSMGPARTFVRLRTASTSGIRASVAQVNAGGMALGAATSAAITLEAAMVQWAGFTFGRGSENYAMMPGIMYGGAPWAGFPSGMNQLAYTQNLGGGFSATIALEDRRDTFVQTLGATNSTPTNGIVYVGNIRLDQAWGMAAVHALAMPNSYYKNATGQVGPTMADFSADTGLTASPTTSTTAVSTAMKQGYAIGATVNLKLPMIGAGDNLWLTANYSDGAISTILGGATLNAVNTVSQNRLLGGVFRSLTNIVQTSQTSVDNVTAWNVGGLFTHYWAPQWRSNFVAGYVEIIPPTKETASIQQWGKGQLQNYMGSLIYSPAKDLDIGLELQYAQLKNKVQGTTALTDATGLKATNWSTKLRVERNF